MYLLPFCVKRKCVVAGICIAGFISNSAILNRGPAEEVISVTGRNSAAELECSIVSLDSACGCIRAAVCIVGDGICFELVAVVRGRLDITVCLGLRLSLLPCGPASLCRNLSCSSGLIGIFVGLEGACLCPKIEVAGACGIAVQRLSALICNTCCR